MRREPVVMSLGSGRLRLAYDALMIGLALLVVLLLFSEDTGWVLVVNRVVYGLFVADYVTRLALSTDKKAFLRANIVDLLAIIPADQFRSLRLLRLLRVVRAVAMLGRATRDLRSIFGTNGLSWVLLVAALIVTISASVVRAFEDSIATWGDAFWWAIVTATTVGYGDISPASVEARVIAVVLMFVGIGTIGMLTGAIATYFISGPTRPSSPHVEHLRELLAKWDDLSLVDRKVAADLLAKLAVEPVSEHLTET